MSDNSDIHIDISSHCFRTLHIDGKRIHSIYNPLREAAGFAKAIPENKIIILLGASIGYLCTAIKKQFPNSLLIGIYLHSSIHENADEHPQLCWYPNAGNTDDAIMQSLQHFLFSNLPENMLVATQVVEWEPMLSSFPKIVPIIRRAIQKAMERIRRNIFTTAYFGRRWVRNAVINYLRCKSQLPFPARQSKVVVIATPGWSIQEHLPFIAENRSKIILLSLSSAYSILYAHKIQPDYIVHSDGGYWAKRYITRIHNPVPILTALHAALPASIASNVIFFSQGYDVEQDIAAAEGFPSIQDTASVAGAALELALKMTSTMVLFAGLDLCPYDIISHGRGHLSERVLRLKTHRVFPEEGARFSHLMVGNASALRLYAEWFQEYLGQAMPLPVARLAPHGGTSTGMQELHHKEAAAYFRAGTEDLQSKNTTLPLSSIESSISKKKALVHSILQHKEETLTKTQNSFAYSISPVALHSYVQNGENESDWQTIKNDVHDFVSTLRSKYIEKII